MKKHYYLAFPLVVVIWCAYLFLMYEPLGSMASKGLLGDSFGALSSLFSGLALAGLVITILQQQDEISKLGREQDLTRELLNEQISVLRATARLNYLNDVIARQREVLEENPDNGSHSSGLRYQEAQYRLKISVEDREKLVRSLES